ncbi:MAG: 23S rRNA (guanosine(2251)-2'-O)-methyltransferase RlmB [Paludibacteraceae bacterium]|nr:23S rRNA (guanosine(2251)-2'-O)-methyltransferase RlmB [Candidatus Physcocola equi]MCQ2233192.1 23S rRNA (guanosine(2251)-2'-O)-methyltransferase RlmB [Paludibacteraceae bacterium]
MKESEMIFGIHAIVEALEANREIDKVLVKKDLSSELSNRLFLALKDHPMVQVQRVPVQKLNSYTLKNHEGAIALVSKIEYQKLSGIVPAVYEEGKDPLIVMLDGVTDVRNFGSIARTCECAGADAVVIPIKGGAMVNADAMRTSAGALNSIPVCKERSLTEAIRFARNSGLKVIAVAKGAHKMYTDVELSGPIALVFADDKTDVSADVLRSCDVVVSVPTRGAIDSLNVSVAAGVVLYEAMKQRVN